MAHSVRVPVCVFQCACSSVAHTHMTYIHACVHIFKNKCRVIRPAILLYIPRCTPVVYVECRIRTWSSFNITSRVFTLDNQFDAPLGRSKAVFDRRNISRLCCLSLCSTLGRFNFLYQGWDGQPLCDVCCLLVIILFFLEVSDHIQHQISSELQ